MAVQDAARPCTGEALIAATIDAARETGAAVAAQPVTDTIKESADSRVILRTLDRSRLWSVQTPQTFRVEVIRRALAEVRRRGLIFTDDTAASELIGQPIRLVPSMRRIPKSRCRVICRLSKRCCAPFDSEALLHHTLEFNGNDEALSSRMSVRLAKRRFLPFIVPANVPGYETTFDLWGGDCGAGVESGHRRADLPWCRRTHRRRKIRFIQTWNFSPMCSKRCARIMWTAGT